MLYGRRGRGLRAAFPDDAPLTETSSHPLLSVVVPVRNEVGNIAPLVADIEKAGAAIGPFELVYVNVDLEAGMSTPVPPAIRRRMLPAG